MTDIITTIIKEFQSRTTIPPEIAYAIEKDIRQRWGGGTAYIGKTLHSVGRATASSLPDKPTELVLSEAEAMSGAKSPSTSLRAPDLHKGAK